METQVKVKINQDVTLSIDTTDETPITIDVAGGDINLSWEELQSVYKQCEKHFSQDVVA